MQNRSPHQRPATWKAPSRPHSQERRWSARLPRRPPSRHRRWFRPPPRHRLPQPKSLLALERSSSARRPAPHQSAPQLPVPRQPAPRSSDQRLQMPSQACRTRGRSAYPLEARFHIACKTTYPHFLSLMQHAPDACCSMLPTTPYRCQRPCQRQCLCPSICPRRPAAQRGRPRHRHRFPCWCRSRNLFPWRSR